MTRKGKKSNQQPGALGRVHPRRLTNGWAGANGTRLRLARPGESDEIVPLVEMAAGPTTPEVRAIIDSSTTSAALLAALRGTPLATQDPVELSAILVAVLDERVVGAIYAKPPTEFMIEMVKSGRASHQSMIPLMTAVTKFAALAVEPEQRGNGIATNLLDGCVRLYRETGFRLAYGVIDKPELAPFYSARSFEVLPVGDHIPLLEFTNLPLGIRAGNDQIIRRRLRP